MKRAAAILVACLLVASPAEAFWTSGGTGTGTAGAGDLSSPRVGLSKGSNAEVIVTLTRRAALSAAGSAVGYVVERAPGTSGGAYAAVSAGDCAGTLPANSSGCTDTSTVDASEYSYRVVAVAGSWTATSNAVAIATGTAADTIPPVVTSITRAAGSPTSAASVAWTVTFSEPVTGVDAGDFALVAGGVSGGAITSVTGSDAVWTVTAESGSGSGTYGLDLVDDDTIVDTALQPLGGVGTTGETGGTFTGEVYTLDRDAPTGSIGRADATPTASGSVRWTVTFSEPVTGVDATDFSLVRSDITGGAITDVRGSGTTWTVTAGTGSGSGTLRLDLIDDDTIQDTVGNPSGGAGAGNGNLTGATYTFDRTAPVVSSFTRVGSTSTAESTVQFTIVFSETVTGVDASDFAFHFTDGSVWASSITAVSGSGTTYTVTASTGTGEGQLGLKLVDDDSIRDGVGNPLGGAGRGNGDVTGPAFTIDRTPPAAPTITPSQGNPWFRSTLTLTGTAEAGATVTVSEGTVVQATATAAANGTWSATLSDQTTGRHTYTATARDAAGNTSGASKEERPRVDASVPVVASAAVVKTEGGANTARDAVRQGGTYRVYANVTEAGGSGLTGVSAGLTNLSGSGASAVALQLCDPAVVACTVAGTTYSHVSAVQTVTNPLAEGARSFTVVATDGAGNQGSGGALSATVDNTRPTAASVGTGGAGDIQNGIIEPGDRLTLTFNEAVDGVSVVSGWAFPWTSTTDVRVRVIDGGAQTDTLQIRSADGLALLPLGTIDLGVVGYITTGAGTWAELGTSASPSTMTRSSGTFTVTFGAKATGTSGALSTTAIVETSDKPVTITWRTGTTSTAYDAAGNLVADSTVAHSGYSTPKRHF